MNCIVCNEDRPDDVLRKHSDGLSYHNGCLQKVRRVAEENRSNLLDILSEGALETFSDIYRAKPKRFAAKERPRQILPKKEDKRKKELSKLNQVLESKEPVKLTPVVVTLSLETKNDTSKSVSCDFCHESIETHYVLVKPRNGSDVVCHETCWKKCEYNLCDIRRIYRYNCNGKLLEKIAFAAQEKQPTKSKPPEIKREEILPTPLKVVSAEYKPSWREVDVHDYEIVKKDTVSNYREKRERRLAKEAIRASKCLDVASLSMQDEKNLQKEADKAWNEVFDTGSSRDESAMTIPFVKIEKEEFTTACCEMLKPRVVLSATAAEYVPLRRVLPPPILVPLCLTCGRFPIGIINFPCGHATRCVHCFHYIHICVICSSYLPPNTSY